MSETKLTKDNLNTNTIRSHNRHTDQMVLTVIKIGTDISNELDIRYQTITISKLSTRFRFYFFKR